MTMTKVEPATEKRAEIFQSRRPGMKRIVTILSVMILIFVVAAAEGQTSAPKPAPELKQWDVWIGDWALSGTAKDTPTGPEYKVDWHMHGHWILGGFFVQIDQTWKGNGEDVRILEFLYYDPIKKIHAGSGFANDGTTWPLTATFDNQTSVEDFTVTSPDGKLTRCRNTWVFGSDRMSVSGTQECEQNGARFTGFKVNGTKSKAKSAEKK
jgi:hypothetical protein